MAWTAGATPASGVQAVTRDDVVDEDEKTDRMADFARLLALSIPPADEEDGDANARDDYESDDEITAIGPAHPSSRPRLFMHDVANDVTRERAAPPPSKGSLAVTLSVATGIANVACIAAVVVLGILAPHGVTSRSARVAVITDVHRATFAATERVEAPAPPVARAVAHAKNPTRIAPRQADARIIRTSPF